MADTVIHQGLGARSHRGNVSGRGRVFPSTEKCWGAHRAHSPPPAKHHARRLGVCSNAEKAGPERTWATAQIWLEGLNHVGSVTITQGTNWPQQTAEASLRASRGKQIPSTRCSFCPTIPLLTSSSRADTFPIPWMAFTRGAFLGPRQGTSAELSWLFSEGRNGGSNKARQRLR